jgi:hypothetical protein
VDAQGGNEPSFDLGVVVNRAAIRVDPDTAQATVVTDRCRSSWKGYHSSTGRSTSSSTTLRQKPHQANNASATVLLPKRTIKWFCAFP